MSGCKKSTKSTPSIDHDIDCKRECCEDKIVRIDRWLGKCVKNEDLINPAMNPI
jgi:hypothetical protein